MLTPLQTHFVHFDQDDKITQIRLSWDQGDLLKQVDVIGTRGKNWPVYSGKDQIKMITTSANTANEVNPAPISSPRGRNRPAERDASPSKKFIKDPHASLDLYEDYKEERTPTAPNAVAPRESAKPAPREMSDIFAAGHEDYESRGPDGSPRKTAKDNVIAPKGAAHKRFQPSRVFEEEEVKNKPERQIYKTNPARYNHFDIGDPDENDHFQHRGENTKPKDVPIRPKGGAHHSNAAQWDFDDVATPGKVGQKVRDQDVVHFSYEDAGRRTNPVKPTGKPRRDEETHFEFHDNGTPITRNAVHKPRKDQVNHFDFNDEPTPGPQRRIIARTKAAQKLYADPVFGEEEEDERPLQTISHNARKDLASQWDTNDHSPVNSKTSAKASMRKGLESHWGMEDDEVAPKQQQPVGRRRKEVEKGFWDD